MQHQELTASKCPSLCFNVVPTSLPGIGGMREASRDCPRRFNVAPTSLPGIAEVPRLRYSIERCFNVAPTSLPGIDRTAFLAKNLGA